MLRINPKGSVLKNQAGVETPATENKPELIYEIK
jgi:hypothetical protein